MTEIPSWIPPGQIWIEVIDFESALTALELLLDFVYRPRELLFERESDTLDAT